MANTYTIQPGDTLSGIASRYGLNWRDLANWNQIQDPNRIYAGRSLNLSNPIATPVATPTTSTIGSYSAPTPATITPFSQILDMSKIFPTATLSQLAEEQVAPDIQRQQQQETENLGRSLASSGTYRTGHAPVAQQRVIDAYSRMLKEQKSQFTNQIQDWLNNWYTQQYTNYYKNPSAFVMPTLPTFDQYLNSNPSIASAYNSYLNK